jgi:hypothetical protein
LGGGGEGYFCGGSWSNRGARQKNFRLIGTKQLADPLSSPKISGFLPKKDNDARRL